MMNKKHLVLLASAGAITLAGVATAQADTLADTMERGAVQCGVSDGLPGFSARTMKVTGKDSTLTYVVPLPPPFSVMLMR